MDTKKDISIVQCDTMAEICRDNVVVGVKQLKKALRAGRVQSAFFAADADPAVTEPVAALCSSNGVPVTWVKSTAQLGKACGIDVGAAAAATVISI